MDCLVSVIVPVHNTVEYLPRCIDSIRNQSLKDIEIILVENQSNDGSAALCDEYMSFDSRVKVLHLPVANASIARNAGLDIWMVELKDVIKTPDRYIYAHRWMY